MCIRCGVPAGEPGWPTPHQLSSIGWWDCVATADYFEHL
jgi:hypothetical protein